jgi:hypothetical protein
MYAPGPIAPSANINFGGEMMDFLPRLEEHERRLSELYRTYGELFPAKKNFWLDLAQEELGHALWLRNFGAKAKEGKLSFKKTKITAASVETSLRHIDKQLDLAKEGQVNLLGALATARDLENALIDNMAMAMVQSNEPLVKNLLDKLHLESEQHRNRIADELIEVKNKK